MSKLCSATCAGESACVASDWRGRRFRWSCTRTAGLLLALVSAPAAVLYPEPAGIAAAADFEVRVDGKPAFVYDSPVGPFVHFSMSAPVEVTITVRSGVRYTTAHEYVMGRRRYKPEPIALPLQTVDIRPKSARIVPFISGETVRFGVPRPLNLSIEFGGNLTRPLFLFAAPEERDAPSPGVSSVRYFAPGKVYDVGRLQLMSGESVYIAGGAVVRGTILTDGAENVRIHGRGVLDGSDETKAAGAMIELRRSRNVRVEGIVILNNRNWTVIPRSSRNVTFDNIKMIAWNNNSDGIDIVGSKDVTIRSSFFRNNDDCIPIKATPPAVESRGSSQYDVENVLVSECVLWAQGGNAFEIGFELRTKSVRHVVLRNSDLIHVRGGAAFSIHNGDWADVSDIEINDVRVEDAPDELIDIFIGLSIYSADAPREYSRVNPSRKPVPPELREPGTGIHAAQWIRLPGVENGVNRGRVRDVRFLNIQVTSPCPTIARLAGYDAGHPVENVLIEGLTIGGAAVRTAEGERFIIRNAKNIRFK
jgi:hypothetical protein